MRPYPVNTLERTRVRSMVRDVATYMAEMGFDADAIRSELVVIAVEEADRAARWVEAYELRKETAS